jgi:hypothetical protein
VIDPNKPPLQWLTERLEYAAYNGLTTTEVSVWHLARVREELVRLNAELATGAAELLRAAKELDRASKEAQR